jgi:hypothetical protein
VRDAAISSRVPSSESCARRRPPGARGDAKRSTITEGEGAVTSQRTFSQRPCVKRMGGITVVRAPWDAGRAALA